MKGSNSKSGRLPPHSLTLVMYAAEGYKLSMVCINQDYKASCPRMNFPFCNLLVINKLPLEGNFSADENYIRMPQFYRLFVSFHVHLLPLCCNELEEITHFLKVKFVSLSVDLL